MKTDNYIDFETASDAARDKRQAEYEKGLKEACPFTTRADIAGVTLRHLAEETADVDGGKVARLENYHETDLDVIGYVLSFRMECEFAFWEYDEATKKYAMIGGTDCIPAANVQERIYLDFRQYIMALAARARTIGSSTYDGWRELLIELEYDGSRGIVYFKNSKAFASFKDRLIVLYKQLWADNAIAARLQELKSSKIPKIPKIPKPQMKKQV